MKETDWFSIMALPARPGVYKTRHRGSDGKIYEGYSLFSGKWNGIRSTARLAADTIYVSPQQSKEWKGLTHEH